MAGRQRWFRDDFFPRENSNSQDPIVYTDGSVSKNQSGWDFTVKQGANTIHEDSAAYTVAIADLRLFTLVSTC